MITNPLPDSPSKHVKSLTHPHRYYAESLTVLVTALNHWITYILHIIPCRPPLDTA